MLNLTQVFYLKNGQQFSKNYVVLETIDPLLLWPVIALCGQHQQQGDLTTTGIQTSWKMAPNSNNTLRAILRTNAKFLLVCCKTRIFAFILLVTISKMNKIALSTFTICFCCCF